MSWPFKQEEVRRTVDLLKTFTEAVDRALNVDNNEAIRRIDRTTERIEISMESAESRGAKEKVLDWLSHPDPSNIHEIRRCDRNDRAKTGKWFLEGSTFQTFKATPQSVLWLHGDSGCGKSVLCSGVIDEICVLRNKDPRIKLAYWYFSVTDKTRMTLETFLRALIAQLVLECPLPPFLLESWRARKMGREPPRVAELMQIIQKLLVGKPPHIFFIIVDAVDESEENERAELMQFLCSLTLFEADIHIFMTSRTNTAGVEKVVKDLANFYNVAMEGQDSDRDIVAHVTERLENDAALAKWSPELRQSIKNALVKDAGGMFRWVECQLQAIRKCRKPAEVKKALKSLPKNLHEVYARELAKVDESAMQDVLRLLEWLAFPLRKLRIEEAIDMLAVDLESDPPMFDEDNRIVDPEEMLNLCGSLVRLDPTTKSETDVSNTMTSRTLTTAHTSVIEFLTTQPIKIGGQGPVIFSRAKAHVRMAETCLVYLHHLLENAITLTEANIQSYPFARVSAMIWIEFYQEIVASSGQVDMARLDGMIMELFTSAAETRNWIRLFDPDKSRDDPGFDAVISEVKPAIYYAARLGLPNIVRRLIQKEHPINEVVGPPFGTPLVAASAMGWKDIVSLLLDGGANPNLSGYFYYGTPLAAAITFGRVEVVAILLGAKGINLNTRRHPPVEASERVCGWLDEYRYLAGKASTDGDWYRKRKGISRYIELGEILIELGQKAEPGEWGDLYFRGLYSSNETTKARFENQLEHVILSLGMEGKVNNDYRDSDTFGMSQYEAFFDQASTASYRIMWSNQGMVYIATEYDNLDILELLVAAGANPNVQGGFYGTALQNACLSGTKTSTIFETLLRNGARCDVYGGYCGSALNVASKHGSIDMVESLIRNGADVNGHNAWNSSPLYHASLSGRADVVTLLLRYGAQTNVSVDANDNPLLVTSAKGNIDIVQILLDAGTDINAKGDRTGTALYLACENQEKKLVELLLHHGANPNIQQCGTRDHALQEACESGHEEIVELLLDNGAVTDLSGGHYGNALQAACVSGNESIARILLSHGADVSANVWNFGSPLMGACTSGRVEIVKLLAEAGADLHSTDLVGHSVVHTSILSPSTCHQDIEILDYLVSRGADSLHEDKRGCNGLHYAARAKRSDVIRWLLGHGLDINATDHNGWSPLHWAVASMEHSADVTRLLLDSGCDKSLEDKQGRTALHLAQTYRKIEDVAILEANARANTTKVFQDDDDDEVKLADSRICDACEIDVGHFCKTESWYRCQDCLDFDLCCRCILDKDVIHFKDHTFSDRPA